MAVIFRHGRVVSATLGVLGVAGWVVGQAPPTASADPVLHEFVSDVRGDPGLVLGPSGGPRSPSADPAAIVYEGSVLFAPTDGALQSDERALGATNGDPPFFRPDRITRLTGTVGYYSVFTPTVAPYKRVTALDSVELDADGVPWLTVRDSRTVRVPVHDPSHPPPDPRPRDRFWGSVVVDLAGGRPVPLPVISPESRVIHVRTIPSTRLKILRDAADNFYVQGVGAPPSEPVRLVYLLDAPQTYFSGPLPDAPTAALAGEVRSLPRSVRRDADQFLQEIGVDRRGPINRSLGRLVSHFRSFEEADGSEARSGSIFLDLARQKKGICRHRTYAFVISAMALGVPARFVMNEAHSWAEVRMPEIGWMRIDLGGAVRGLTLRNADGRTLYRPVHPDSWPQPPAYRTALAQAQRPARAPPEASPGAEPEATAAPAPAEVGGVPVTADRERLFLQLEDAPRRVLRGGELAVAGRALTSRGQGVGELRIEVRLEGRQALLLGVTVSDSGGRFRGTFGVPPDLAVGGYALVVRTPGDSRYAAATAP